MNIVPLAACAISVELSSSIAGYRLGADQSGLVNRHPHLNLQRVHAFYEVRRW
jgi:hypothetical protein